RLDDEKVAIDTLDLPDHGHGLGLLSRSRCDRERRSEGRSSENACNFHVIPPLWNAASLYARPHPKRKAAGHLRPGDPITRSGVTSQPFLRSERLTAILADVDARCCEGAVRLLGGRLDAEGRASLDVVLAADFIAHDVCVRGYDNSLVAFLVLHD